MNDRMNRRFKLEVKKARSMAKLIFDNAGEKALLREVVTCFDAIDATKAMPGGLHHDIIFERSFLEDALRLLGYREASLLVKDNLEEAQRMFIQQYNSSVIARRN